jgi:hypothetical protein
VLPRSDLAYRTSAWLLCQAGGKWRKPEVMLPILLEAGRSAFEAVPACLSGSVSMLELVSRHGAAPCSAV